MASLIVTFVRKRPGQVDLHLTKNLTCFSCMSGIILQEKVPAFEKILWRLFHRNICIQVIPLETPFEDPEHVSCCWHWLVGQSISQLLFKSYNWLDIFLELEKQEIHKEFWWKNLLKRLR